MPLPPLRIPKDSSTFSPLVIEALKLLQKSYLYPSLFQLAVVKSDSDSDSTSLTVEFRIHLPTWKFFPWLLNVFFVMGVLVFGSCLYVCFAPFFFPVGFEISTPIKILNYGFPIFPFLAVVATCEGMRRPELAQLFNYIVLFEMKCKMQKLKSSYFCIMNVI